MNNGWHLLGTPDTNLRGLRTLNARRAFTSKAFCSNKDNTVLATLKSRRTRSIVKNQM